MSVGSISSVSFSFSSSTQQLSYATRIKLQELGLNPQDYKTETEAQQAITTAQASQNTQNASSTKSTDDANKASTQMNSQQGSAPSWISLMKQNGIEPTGSIDGDKAAVTSALSTMDQTQAKSLASQFQSVGLAVSAPSESNNQSTDPFAGQNQLAAMNKYFLVNKAS